MWSDQEGQESFGISWDLRSSLTSFVVTKKARKSRANVLCECSAGVFSGITLPALLISKVVIVLLLVSMLFKILCWL